MAAVIVAREVHHRARDNFVDTIYSSLCESIARTQEKQSLLGSSNKKLIIERTILAGIIY